MLMTRSISIAYAAGLTVLAPGLACGQDFPTRPIRILTGAAGGSADFASRQLAQGLTVRLGQQVIVDNRSVVATDIVAKAPPDAYSLLLDGGSFWIAPLLQDTPYDVVRDFSPISSVITSPNVLVVHPSVAANSVKDLIALAKAKPGALNFASSGTGGSSHLSGELFKAMAGVNMVHVPFKGSGAALASQLAGEAQLQFSPAATAAPHVKSGRLRALAATTAQPSPLAPGLPTVAATLPGYEAIQILGIFAPAKTPTARINRLSHEIVQILKQREVIDQLAGFGMEATGSAPEELAATLKTEIAKWGKLIKDAGVRAN